MFWRKANRERDLDEEIRTHFRMAEQDGRTAEAARREFGNITQIKETARELWGWGWFDRLAQDVRFAVRTFTRNPGATIIIVLTLAAGIGANTAVFSILDAVLLKQLPYRDPGRLVSILDLEKKAGGRATFFDLYSDYENWTKNSRLFEGFAASTWAGGLGKILSGGGPARSVAALPVTADYFNVLGVQPAVGRTFQPSDRDRGCVVVLSDAFWRSAGGPVGKPLRLDNQDCTVLGVMPPGFAVYPNPASMLWLLMARPDHPDRVGVFVTGRLKPGVSMAAAEAELVTLHRQLHQHDRWGALMEPRIYELQSEFTWLTGHNLKLSLMVLFAAVTVVLLICCANVSNLLVGQSLARQREMAIRAALGSGRARLLRQLLTESLLLGLSAAFTGALLATAAVYYFRAANPIDLPPATIVRVDAGILAFTMLLSIVATVVFGLAPSWKTSRADLNTALKAGGRSSSQDAGAQRFGHSLIVVEVALTVILLAGAGLLIQSVNNFASAPLGFQADGLITASIRLPQENYAKPEQRVQFYDRLLDTLRSSPGVEGEALSTFSPASGPGAVSVLAVEGQPDPEAGRVPDVGTQPVSPDYFRVMKMPLRRGRFFDERDRQNSEPVTIVNESLAGKYFPNEDPVGKRVRAFDGPGNNNRWLRIIGVVGNERRTATASEMGWEDAPVTYLPWSQNAAISGVVLLKTRLEGAAIAGLIQRASGDPDIAVGDIETVPRAIAKILAYPRFRALLLAGFAGLALLLALVGLYGVLSRLVARRTQEIGIRMALGARRADVLAMVAREGMALAAIGVVLGLVSVWGLTRLMKALLYGVSATDPVTLGLVTAAILGSAALAAFVPARRATRVDPMIALRDE